MIPNDCTMTSISFEISNPCNERCVHCYRVCEGTKRGFHQLHIVLHSVGEIDCVQNQSSNIAATASFVLKNGPVKFF